MTWETQGEREVINKPEYRFVLEEFRNGEDQMVFLHLDVNKWATSVFREILRNWKLFRECITCPVFVHAGNPHGSDLLKWEKFVTLLGFKPLMDVVCENGAQRRLFVHYKEAASERSKNKNNDLFDEQYQYRSERHDEQLVEHQPVVGAVTVHSASLQPSSGR